MHQNDLHAATIEHVRGRPTYYDGSRKVHLQADGMSGAIHLKFGTLFFQLGKLLVGSDGVSAGINEYQLGIACYRWISTWFQRGIV